MTNIIESKLMIFSSLYHNYPSVLQLDLQYSHCRVLYIKAAQRTATALTNADQGKRSSRVRGGSVSLKPKIKDSLWCIIEQIDSLAADFFIVDYLLTDLGAKANVVPCTYALPLFVQRKL